MRNKVKVTPITQSERVIIGVKVENDRLSVNGIKESLGYMTSMLYSVHSTDLLSSTVQCTPLLHYAVLYYAVL